MEFKELQKFMKVENQRLNDYYSFVEPKNRKFAQTLKIVEEVGELSEQILRSENIQRKEKLAIDKGPIAHEFADVLIVTMLLADSLGIDVEKALDEKIQKIKERNY